jgi:hypothetical protein
LVFFRLNELERGDGVTPEYPPGSRYAYQVTGRVAVGPEGVQALTSVAGGALPIIAGYRAHGGVEVVSEAGPKTGTFGRVGRGLPGSKLVGMVGTEAIGSYE